MRQIVLDTETTGLDPARGHRVVEIGCIELVERRRTGREFQCYLNPERAMDIGAMEVTGLTDDFLRDKPLFRHVAEEFLAFIDGAELVIHNAAFDIGFLNAEIARLGGARIDTRCTVLDTLSLAREKYPGQKNSLDALCKRLQVDSAHRRLHGALLDANLLTDVYLALTAGQGDLGFETVEVVRTTVEVTVQTVQVPSRLRLVVADADDLALHQRRLAQLEKSSKGSCLWLALEV
jgi:DNA polymerase-3 subunit epsilon